MEIVDGCLLLEQQLLLVLYLQIVQQLQEQLLQSAKLGDQLVYQMELLVLQNLHVPHIQLKLLAEIQEQTVLASG